ncbi:MAG: hypothetical protein H0W88_08110 [Parachlamydiaceae bacterium]|nr:hypothetical protein [Parachlamydiaceae bacterium]
MYKRQILYVLYIVAMMSLAGCQYRFGYGDLTERYSTINVPYAEGDPEGELTAEVIKKISASGAFKYVPCGGDLTLSIQILEFRDENIGFRYDRNKHGHLKTPVIPTETRLSAIVEVELISNATNQVIRGPTQIRASVDFDHDYYTTRHGINIFSLGQLSDIDAGQEAAMQPLNRRLAEKITEYIINSW